MARGAPTPEQRAQIGTHLRATRELRGVTQKDLNRAIGGQAVNQIEQGRAAPSMSLLFGLVEALGCTWSEVLGPEPSSDGGRSADWEAGYRAGIGEAHAALSRLLHERE